MSIRQFRSHDLFLLSPCRVYLTPQLYYVLNIALFLNYGVIEPYSLQVSLCMVFFYLSILLYWCNTDLTLPYGLILLTYFNFTINTYIWLYNTPVSHTPLFRAQLCKKILLVLFLTDIAFVLLDLYLHPLLSPLLGPLLLPLKLSWLIVILFCIISPHTI